MLIHLRVYDPRSTIPRGSVKGTPEVEEEDGSIATRGERLGNSCRSCGSIDERTGKVASKDGHTDSTANSSNEQQVTTAELIDQEEQPDKRKDSLDNTKQASSKERGVSANNAERLEDGR